MFGRLLHGVPFLRPALERMFHGVPWLCIPFAVCPICMAILRLCEAVCQALLPSVVSIGRLRSTMGICLFVHADAVLGPYCHRAGSADLLPPPWERIPTEHVQPHGWFERSQMEATEMATQFPPFEPQIANPLALGGHCDVEGGLHESTPYWLNGATSCAIQLNYTVWFNETEVCDDYPDSPLEDSQSGWRTIDLLHAVSLVLLVSGCAVPNALRGVDLHAAIKLARKRSQLKYTHSMFKVLPVPSDGNCLFASVAISEAVTAGLNPSAAEVMFRAAELRAAAMAEMRERRAEIEWSIPGDFDEYVGDISQPGTFAGEHELLMLAHHLQKPILVYAFAPELRCITVYTEELVGTAVPLRVLYLGFGVASAEHYEGLAHVRHNDGQGGASQEAASLRHSTPNDRPRQAEKPKAVKAANQRWTLKCPKMFQCCWEGFEALWRRS